MNWDKNGVNQDSFILSSFRHILSDTKIIDDTDNYWKTQSRSVNLKEKIKVSAKKKMSWGLCDHQVNTSQRCDVSDKTTK